MDEDSDPTVNFGEDSNTKYLDQLENTFGGSWSRVENARAFQCDLGHGMCNVMIEHAGSDWVGKLTAVNPPIEEKTDPCSDLTLVILRLRVLIRDHGLLLQNKAQELIDIASEAQ